MTNFRFRRPQSYPRKGKTKVTKFCMQVEYIQCQPWDDRVGLSPNERGQSHVTRCFNFAPSHMTGFGNARQFKFRVLIDAHDACIIYYPIYPETGRVQSQAYVTSLNFGK